MPPARSYSRESMTVSSPAVSAAGGDLRKPFLILQLRPEDVTSDDEFDAILKHGGIEPGRARRIRLESLPRGLRGLPRFDLSDYAAVIVGGSPFDLSTPSHRKSALQRRIEADLAALLDQIVCADHPFLGACSGCGLLGTYLGTTVSTKHGEGAGVVAVSLTPEAADDPLLDGFPPTMRVLLGHKEACDDVPKGATLLASGENCPVQMFRVGKNVYATQFHPELDGEGFSVRVNAYRNHGYFEVGEADHLISLARKEDTPWSKELLRRFVERYSG